MKSALDLFTNINYILRLIEGVLCLVGMIYYYNVMGVLMVFAYHGWFYLALCYSLAYIWEDPNMWMEAFALGLYAIIMLTTAFVDLSENCILPFVLAILMIADIAVLVIMKSSK